METTTTSISSRLLARVDKFLPLVCKVYKLAPDDIRAKSIFESECYNFERAIHANADLMETTAMSQDGLFLEVLGSGLTFNPADRHLHLIYRKGKIVDTDENGTKSVREVKNLSYYPSAEGKQFRCIASGSINHVGHPVVVYEGDVFEPGNVDGLDKLTYIDKTNGANNRKVVAGFVWVHFNGNRPPELFKMWMHDVERLRQYSQENNAGKANKLYTANDGQIDTGFFKAKLVTHALRPYNKTSSPFEASDEEFGEIGAETIIDVAQTSKYTNSPGYDTDAFIVEIPGYVGNYGNNEADKIRTKPTVAPLPRGAAVHPDDKNAQPWVSSSGRVYEPYPAAEIRKEMDKAPADDDEFAI